MVPEIKKILYATDLSKNSIYAYFYAVDMAKRHNAEIVILHAIEPIPAYAGAKAAITDEMKLKREERTIEELTKQLQEFCKRAEAQQSPECVGLVSKILVTRGYPAEEILNATNGEGCDLIVLGSHGKGFLAHTFLGSVSNAVLHRTQKPVFIIPLPSEKTTLDWDGA